MDGLTRREVLLTAGILLHAETPARSDEPVATRRIATSSIPKQAELVGMLGKPLCTLVSFSGLWSSSYDHSIKGDSLHLNIRRVNDIELTPVPAFPIRLINILYQTTGMITEETLEAVREGDLWEGQLFETAEIGWIPAAVYRLPDIVPWRDGRPEEVVSRLTCVLLKRS